MCVSYFANNISHRSHRKVQTYSVEFVHWSNKGLSENVHAQRTGDGSDDGSTIDSALSFQCIFKALSEPSKEVVELFFSCANIRENISQKSIASYVISMTRQASHVMEVCSKTLNLALWNFKNLVQEPSCLLSVMIQPYFDYAVIFHFMKQVLFLGWFSCKNLLEKKASGEWNARLVVAPLFETIPDLEVLLTWMWLFVQLLILPFITRLFSSMPLRIVIRFFVTCKLVLLWRMMPTLTKHGTLEFGLLTIMLVCCHRICQDL